jgi:hypothetical protein
VPSAERFGERSLGSRAFRFDLLEGGAFIQRERMITEITSRMIEARNGMRQPP